MSVAKHRIQLASAICTSIAICTTLLRLYVRRRTLWVDDAFAFLSMASISTQLGVLMAPTKTFNTYTRSYLVIFLFYATIWCARTSILFTIIRVGQGSRRKLFLYSLITAFVILFGLLVGQIFWVCEGRRKHGRATCVPNKQIALTQLVSDIFADLSLLIASLQLFLVIQDKSLRHRFIYIFSTCTATSIVSLIHSALILRSSKNRRGQNVIIAALVEDSVSLIVSSLPVIANLFFQLRDRSSPRVSVTHTDTDTTNPLSLKFASPTSTQLGPAGDLFQVDSQSHLPLSQLPSLSWQTQMQIPAPAQTHQLRERETVSMSLSKSTSTSLPSLRRFAAISPPNLTVVNG